MSIDILKSLEPNIFVNFPKTYSKANIPKVGIRGVVALPIPLSWGNAGEVVELNSEIDIVNYFGRAIVPKEIALTFMNANKIILLNIAGDGTKAQVDLGNSIIAKAKFDGVLGNDINIVTTLIPPINDVDLMRIDVYMGDTIVVRETVSNVKLFPSNKFVVFEGDGLPEQTAGKKMTGGKNGEPTMDSLEKALETLSKYTFNTMPFASENLDVIKLLVAFAEKKYEERTPFTLVVPKYQANHPMVINVANGVVISDVEYKAMDMVYWVAGLQAGISLSSEATAMVVPNATDICDNEGNSDPNTDIREGKFVFVKKINNVKVLMDINSYTGYQELPAGTLERRLDEADSYNRQIRIKQYFMSVLETIWDNHLQYSSGMSENEQIDSIKREIVNTFKEAERKNIINEWDENSLIIERMDKVNNALYGKTEISITSKYLYFVFDIFMTRR